MAQGGCKPRVKWSPGEGCTPEATKQSKELRGSLHLPSCVSVLLDPCRSQVCQVLFSKTERHSFPNLPFECHLNMSHPRDGLERTLCEDPDGLLTPLLGGRLPWVTCASAQSLGFFSWTEGILRLPLIPSIQPRAWHASRSWCL